MDPPLRKRGRLGRMAMARSTPGCGRAARAPSPFKESGSVRNAAPGTVSYTGRRLTRLHKGLFASRPNGTRFASIPNVEKGGHAMAKVLSVLFVGLLLVGCSAPEDPKHAAHVQELIKQLHADTENARWEAADELMRMGPRAKAAIPALIENLGDGGGPHQIVNVAAINALLRIGPRASLPPLMEALKSDDQQIVSGSLATLAGFGAAARPAVPAITKLLDNPKTRGDAASTLKMIRDFP
jgi:hypothetical protein